MFNENKLNPGDGDATGEFSRTYLAEQKLENVENYAQVYRPAQIVMRKEMLKVKGSGSGWNEITMILIGIT